MLFSIIAIILIFNITIPTSPACGQAGLQSGAPSWGAGEGAQFVFYMGMHILYYITAHGYGHAVRSAAVCNCLPPSGDVRLTIVSDIPQLFFKEEIVIPHTVRKGVFDVGCLQSDGVTVQMEETLKAYNNISILNESLLDDEVRWCKDNNVDCIVSDITPFAFEIADKAGILSVAISNFTWYDIYSPYVDIYPQYKSMLSKMADQYSKATLALALYPASPMPLFPRIKSVPVVVGRKGKNRKNEICNHFGIDRRKHLGLIYIGNYGLHNVNWRKLESFADWEFAGVYPLDQNPSNFHLVTKDSFSYRDLSASADIIISKMGYGVFSESLLNGIPLLYLPRDNFSEFETLHAEAQRCGNGIFLHTDSFLNLDWEPYLAKAVKNGKRGQIADNGAAICVNEIMKITDKLM
ncbi:MAG: hypothetical protein FWE57_07675 [Chitinispirillia bacterium]|nr:hypothetical protein [Chitinispirillia bacterium]